MIKLFEKKSDLTTSSIIRYEFYRFIKSLQGKNVDEKRKQEATTKLSDIKRITYDAWWPIYISKKKSLPKNSWEKHSKGVWIAKDGWSDKDLSYTGMKTVSKFWYVNVPYKPKENAVQAFRAFITDDNTTENISLKEMNLEQQDAQEFFSLFLQELIKEDKAGLKDIFQSTQTSSLTCPKDLYQSNKDEEVWLFSLPITGIKTVNEAFLKYFNPETLSKREAWRCPNCNSLVQAKKQYWIKKLSHVLTIGLKRFASKYEHRITFQYKQKDNNWSKNYIQQESFFLKEQNKYVVKLVEKSKNKELFFSKDNRPLPFDLLLTIKPNECQPITYKLFGVILQTGTLKSGHYTAAAKDSISNDWHYYDDSLVNFYHGKNHDNANAFIENLAKTGKYSYSYTIGKKEEKKTKTVTFTPYLLLYEVAEASKDSLKNFNNKKQAVEMAIMFKEKPLQKSLLPQKRKFTLASALEALRKKLIKVAKILALNK